MIQESVMLLVYDLKKIAAVVHNSYYILFLFFPNVAVSENFTLMINIISN